MLGRCYNPKHAQYNNYGAKGVYVEDYFFDFGNYVSYVSRLPNYDNLLCEPEKWQIDKDLSGKSYYSRETISIIPTSLNLEIENQERKIPVRMFKENGEPISDFQSLNAAEKETGISRGNISRAVRTGGKAGGYYWVKNYDGS